MTGADAMSEERFTFPVSGLWFASVCAAVPWVMMAVFILPRFGRGYSIFWGVIGLWGIAPVLIRFRRLFRPVTLTTEGIRVGKGVIKWGKLENISTSSRWGGAFVLTQTPRPQVLTLPARPVTVRRLLPAILRRDPDVLVAPTVRRALADPERATRISRWTGLPLLVAAASVAAWAAYGQYYLPPMAAWILVIPLGIAIGFVPQGCGSAAGAFMSITQSAGWFPIIFIMTTSMICGVPLYVVDAWLASIAAVFLVAGIVALGRLSLAGVQKAIILAVLIGAPIAVYHLGQRSALARADVTDLFGGQETFDPLFWSADGTLAAFHRVAGADGERHVVADLAGNRSVRLPDHGARQWMLWLDRTCACRIVKEEEGDQGLLYVFRFADGREIRLSAIKDPPIPALRHMSPDGRRLCWLGPGRNGQPLALMTYDLEEDRVAELRIDWPEEKDIAWRECGWADDDTLVVHGYGPRAKADDEDEGPQALHVLWVGREDRTVRRTSSSRRFGEWRAGPDGRYAFASEPEAGVPAGVYFLDLLTGRTESIGGKQLPVWAPDGRSALRVTRTEGRAQRLCRFDPEKAAETVMMSIPDGERALAASPRGRFAILGVKGDHGDRPLSLVDTATGQRRHFAGGGISRWSLSGTGDDCSPWQSTFSPDGGTFVLRSQSLGKGEGVRLYRVPAEWLD